VLQVETGTLKESSRLGIRTISDRKAPAHLQRLQGIVEHGADRLGGVAETLVNSREGEAEFAVAWILVGGSQSDVSNEDASVSPAGCELKPGSWPPGRETLEARDEVSCGVGRVGPFPSLEAGDLGIVAIGSEFDRVLALEPP